MSPALPVALPRTDYFESVIVDSSDSDDAKADPLPPRFQACASVQGFKLETYKTQLTLNTNKARRTSLTSGFMQEEATLGFHEKASWTPEQDITEFISKNTEPLSTDDAPIKHQTTGKFASWRGAAILGITSTAQLLDNMS